jgi:hypothetical protein
MFLVRKLKSKKDCRSGFRKVNYLYSLVNIFLMKKFALLIFLLTFNLVFASDMYEEGEIIFEKGDRFVTDDNWLMLISGITSEGVYVDILDPNGVKLPSPYFSYLISDFNEFLKFGSQGKLRFEIELLELIGEGEEVENGVLSYDQIKLNLNLINESLLPKEELTVIIVEDGETIDSIGSSGSSSGNGIFEFVQEDNVYESKSRKFFMGRYYEVIEVNDGEVILLIQNATKVYFGKGWNLFSVPIHDGDYFSQVINSTCANETIWNWNDGYEKFGSLNNGFSIDTSQGYFINIKEECEVTFSGKVGVNVEGKKLKKGWNLIPAPLATLNNLFNQSFNFDTIKGDCNFSNPIQYVARNIMFPGEIISYSKLNEYSVTDEMRLNRGYFLKVKEDCELVQSE